MDQSAPYTPTLNPVTPTFSSFTSIKKLLSSSWDKVQKHLLKLFMLYVVMFVLAIVSFLGAAAILAAAGFFSPLTSGTSFSVSSVQVVVLILLPVVFVAAVVGALALQIATILVLSETQPGLSVIGFFKLAMKKVWPLFLVTLISMFLVFGGLVIFIIPGILFGILLSMAPYFVVVDNLSPMEAIKRSVYVVSKNFGAIFVRLAVLFAISFIAGLVFNALSSMGDSGGILSGLASLIFNLLYGWVSVAYTMLVFQDAKRMAGEGRGKLMWMGVAAVIGWAIIVGGGYMIARAVPNTTTTIPPLELNNAVNLGLPELNATPAATLTPSATPSATVRATATPRPTVRPTATPRATATPRTAIPSTIP